MKSSQRTIRQRVDEILQLRLLGALPTDIRQHADEQKWGVSERQLQRYIAAADERVAASVEKNRDRLMAHHFAARRALYARAMAVSDYRTALAVLDSEAKLFDLYPSAEARLAKQVEDLLAQVEELKRGIGNPAGAGGEAGAGGGGPDGPADDGAG
jgi:hypothetical protein